MEVLCYSGHVAAHDTAHKGISHFRNTNELTFYHLPACCLRNIIFPNFDLTISPIIRFFPWKRCRSKALLPPSLIYGKNQVDTGMAFYDVRSLEDNMRDTVWWYGVVGLKERLKSLGNLRKNLLCLAQIVGLCFEHNFWTPVSFCHAVSLLPKRRMNLHPVWNTLNIPKRMVAQGIVLSQASLNRPDANEVEGCGLAVGETWKPTSKHFW